MQKTAEKNCGKRMKTPAEYFAGCLNEAIGTKWTDEKLCQEANNLSADGKQVFSLRSLQSWLGGKQLPKIESVKAIALVTGDWSLMQKRIDVIEYAAKENERLKKAKKTARAATLTVRTGTNVNNSTDIVSRREAV